MNKKVNERAFNIAIFDEYSRFWRKPLDINKLSPRFKKSVTKESLTPDNALMLEDIIYASKIKLLHRINKGSYVPLYEILNLLGIPFKDNQVLAGWDADNYDPLLPIFEYEYDEENDRYILNFVTCDETMLLKHYEKDRMTSIKKYCDYDASVLQDVYNDIWKIAAISSDHGNALMDIIGPDKYAEIMKKQGK